MTVRRQFLALAALFALLLGAGCREGDRVPLAAETEEPQFQQAQKLAKQGRVPEALTAFLKVIEKRGSQNSPESHLEAGLIYLQHIKDPIEAIHHFRKYLGLLPNSRQANLVRQQVEAANREYATRLPTSPGEDQSLRLETAGELERLRRENMELRAELAALKGGAAPPASRPARMLTLPDELPPPDASAAASPVRPRPMAGSPIQERLPATPPAPAFAAPTRPAIPPSPTAAMRTHVVAKRESLWSIARRYYGPATNAAKVQAIRDANRDVVTDPNNLKVGMTLRIP